VATGLVLVAVAAACTPVAPPPPPASSGSPTTKPPPLRTGVQNGSLGTCPVFPPDNPWNTDVSAFPVHPDSTAIIAQIQGDGADNLHADFGGGGAYGIPYVAVPPNEPKVPINFVDWPEESDPGPYPTPLGAPVEGGSDRHVIAVQRGTCQLYELFNARRVGTTRWDASNGAMFDLTSNALLPDGWTSADAAGLPIFPGLARFDEVAAGEIDHALRVTFERTRRAYISPARHYASSDTTATRPPMGLRLRLQAGYDLSGITGQARVILGALKKYGLLVADNGSNWFITGAADSRWDDDDLNQLKDVPGTAFEVVYTGDPVTG
jgi:hypothetical protein